MIRVDSAKITKKITYLIFSGFALSFIVRVLLTAFRRFDPDEFEHLHASWMIYAGFLPYRDFWQNHTPLLYYMIAPAFRIFDAGVPLLFIVRSIFSASALLILWLTYLLARLDHDRMTAILSALVLSCSYLFLHKTIEIRPDQFLVALWLSSLFLALRFMRANGNSILMFIAGVLLGTGMLFSPKAMLCLAAAFMCFAANWIFVNRSSGFFKTIRACALYGLGFVIPVAGLAAFFYHKGALRLMLESTVLGNLNFQHGRHLAYLLSLRQIVLFLLCSAGVAISVRRPNWYRENRFLLAVPMIFLILIFLFLMPTTNPQSALVFVPLMSIYAGIAFKACLDWYSESRLKHSFALLILTTTAAVLVPCASALYEKPTTPTNKGQIERIDAILKQTNPQDAFFDGNHAYVFRPQAYYYGFLIDAVRLKIERGETNECIPQSLKKNRCKFMIYDDRVALLPESVQSFLRDNFTPAGIPEVYIAGKQLAAENFSGRKATFRIEIPLSYDISVSNTKRFSVDGRLYSGPVILQAGAHEIVAEAPLHSVRIRAAP